MPLQGIHPRLRSHSGDNEAELIALALQQSSDLSEPDKEHFLSSAQHDFDRADLRDVQARESSREINELLNFNASIYDLTVQYSCLAFHNAGSNMVILNLLAFLSLQVGNVYLQMYLLFEIERLIAAPAMTHAQHLYTLFTDHCYGDSAGELAYGDDVKLKFETWNDGAGAELCQFPLTIPEFFFMIILIWTFFLVHELKQTVNFFWHTVRLRSPSEGRVAILDHEGSLVITHMSSGLKVWITVIVFLPKFIIAIVLWYVGAMWLTATPGIDNLMLNSLALTFICELDELIYRTCVSENIKARLDETKLPMPPFKSTPSIWGPLEAASTFLSCIALSSLYLTYFQSVIPHYRWDLAELCRDSNTKGIFHAIAGVSHGHGHP